MLAVCKVDVRVSCFCAIAGSLGSQTPTTPALPQGGNEKIGIIARDLIVGERLSRCCGRWGRHHERWQSAGRRVHRRR